MPSSQLSEAIINNIKVKELPVTAQTINEKDENGLYPIHYAVMIGRIDDVQCLINCPELDLSVTTPKAINALGIAKLMGFTAALTLIKNRITADAIAQLTNNKINIEITAEMKETVKVAAKEIVVEFENRPESMGHALEQAIMAVDSSKQQENIRALLGSGLWTPSVKELTPIHIAAMYAVSSTCPNPALAILAPPASLDTPNSFSYDLNQLNFAGETALFCACINEKNAANVEKLLALGANPNITKAANQWSPLYVACKHGNLAAVECLLKDPRTDITIKNKNELTALNVAAYHGHLEIIQALLNKQKELIKQYHDTTPESLSNFLNTPDKSGARPLHAAIMSGKIAILKLLLEEGADPNQCSDKGISPLYVASCLKPERPDMVSLLLEYHANMEQVSNQGLTPLIAAAFYGNIENTKRLLSAIKTQAKKPNKIKLNDYVNFQPLPLKLSAFYAACQNIHIEVARLLVQAGADNRAIGNGNTSFHAVAIGPKSMLSDAAAMEKQKELLNYLFGVFPDTTEIINSVNENGVTPLYMACEKGSWDIVKLLIRAGANVNQGNQQSVSPLHIAAQNGHLEVVKLLIAAGANVNSQTDKALTAVFFAAQNGHKAIVKTLLAVPYINPNLLTNQKEHPLLIASYFGHVEIVDLLLDHPLIREEINSPDRDGRNALWWTNNARYHDCTERLLACGADAFQADRENCSPLRIAESQLAHLTACITVIKRLISENKLATTPQPEAIQAILNTENQQNEDVKSCIMVIKQLISQKKLTVDVPLKDIKQLLATELHEQRQNLIRLLQIDQTGNLQWNPAWHGMIEQSFTNTKGLSPHVRDLLWHGSWIKDPLEQQKVSMQSAFEALKKNSTVDHYCQALHVIAEGKMDRARLESFPTLMKRPILHLMKLMNLNHINQYQLVAPAYPTGEAPSASLVGLYNTMKMLSLTSAQQPAPLKEPISLTSVHNYFMDLIRSQITILQGAQVANHIAYLTLPDFPLAIGASQDFQRINLLYCTESVSSAEMDNAQQLLTTLKANEKTLQTYPLDKLEQLIALFEIGLGSRAMMTAVSLQLINTHDCHDKTLMDLWQTRLNSLHKICYMKRAQSISFAGELISQDGMQGMLVTSSTDEHEQTLSVMTAESETLVGQSPNPMAYSNAEAIGQLGFINNPSSLTRRRRPQHDNPSDVPKKSRFAETSASSSQALR